MQATENVNASGAPEGPASHTEIPDWLRETPEPREPEECWPPYMLVVQEHEGQHLQTVEMTRAEFITLKKHLAVMRGLPVPKADEGETAAAEAAGNLPKSVHLPKSVQSTTEYVRAELVDSIIETVKGNAEIPPRGNYQPVLGDLAMLKGILLDWEQGSFSDDYPNETPLLAAIRGNLDL